MAAERSTGGSIPRDPPEGGGVGESRPVKEGSRGRPGRDRHKTGPGPEKVGTEVGMGGTDGWKGGRREEERRTEPHNRNHSESATSAARSVAIEIAGGGR